MNIISTKIEGVYLIKPKIFNDDKGSFFESFNMKVFQKETNQKINFVQDNQSVSSKNILRGLHFQKPPHAQAKLVRATHKFKEDSYDDALAYIVQAHDMHKEKSEEIDTDELLGMEAKPRTKW